MTLTSKPTWTDARLFWKYSPRTKMAVSRHTLNLKLGYFFLQNITFFQWCLQWKLVVLMAWCFSTRPSIATALCTHPCVSSCLWVKFILKCKAGRMTILKFTIYVRISVRQMPEHPGLNAARPSVGNFSKFLRLSNTLSMVRLKMVNEVLPISQQFHFT